MGILEGMQIVIACESMAMGFAVAKRCVQEGSRVALGAPDSTNLSSVRQALTQLADRHHRTRPLDVGDFESVRTFAEWAKAEFGRIDGLVNCARVFGPAGKGTEVDLLAFKRTLEINVLGTVAMCRAMRPLFHDGEHRRKIVNFAGDAFRPLPNFSAYATSEAAVVRFTETLALELGDEGFDVNCVAPCSGLVRLLAESLQAAPLLAGADILEGFESAFESSSDEGKRTADLTTFLLSRDSDGISGKLLSADFDPFEDTEFRAALRSDPELATLRRIPKPRAR